MKKSLRITLYNICIMTLSDKSIRNEVHRYNTAFSLRYGCRGTGLRPIRGLGPPRALPPRHLPLGRKNRPRKRSLLRNQSPSPSRRPPPLQSLQTIGDEQHEENRTGVSLSARYSYSLRLHGIPLRQYDYISVLLSNGAITPIL